MMKVWDSVESLVDSLSLLSRRAIWSWPQKLITALPAMIPKGYEAFASEDEYLRVLADTLRAKGWKDAAEQIDEILKGGRT
jgi:hypothetical protein